MVEKIRFGGEWDIKKWIAAILLGVMILAFAPWGVKNQMMGDDTGGVAAMVNDHAISLSEFRQSTERVEQNAKGRFDGLPEAQRRAMTSELRRRVLEQLVLREVVYQAASKKGVIASDAEVRDQILQIPFLKENGRFLNDRYRMWLQNTNMSAEDFEHQIRKDIVTEKLQELFVGSSAPTREELRLNRKLAEQKVSLRFTEITHNDLKKMDSVPDAEVAAYVPTHKKEIEAYYNENKIEYTTPLKYHARDILFRVDQKRTEADAMKAAAELKKDLTAKNFATQATKHTEDPGLKAKGGDLGERQKGSLLGEFEDVVLNLKPGQISEPVKLEGGIHLILLENKTGGGTTSLESAQNDVARRLIARSRETEIVNKLRDLVAKGDKSAVEAMIDKAKLKWQNSGEFDLATNVIPKLGDGKEVMPAVMSQGRNGGLIHQLIPYNGNFLVVDVLSFKETPDKNPEVEGADRMVAYKRAEGAIDAWAKDVREKASIQTSARLLQ